MMAITLVDSLVCTVFLISSLFAGDVKGQGGWLPATDDEQKRFGTTICNIDRVPIKRMTEDAFQTHYKNKPFILEFENGVSDWCKIEYWTVDGLTRHYSDRRLEAGKAIEIVYSGGHGDSNVSFTSFIEEMRNPNATHGDMTYLFDRDFYFKSELPSSLKVPPFLFDKGDPILFIGGSGTGATFHKHMPAWNGVLFGAKRWFLYPVETTPPGGLYAYTTADWMENVYSKLPAEKMPMECVQRAGEIFYVPESHYHAVLNIGETVAISIQMQKTATELETDFYAAMNAHYNSTLAEERLAAQEWRDIANHRYFDLHFLLAAQNAHYNATVTSSDNAQEWRDIANERYFNLHFLLPDNLEIVTHLADIACESGKLKRCERILNYIISKDPYSTEVRKELSRLYYDRGQFDKSEQQLLISLQYNPRNKAILMEHANFLWNVRRGEAKAAYQRVLDNVDPTSADGLKMIDTLKNADFSEPTTQKGEKEETGFQPTSGKKERGETGNMDLQLQPPREEL